MPASMAGVILEETIDEHYEPTEEEVIEYARWLGMDLPEEEELIWIAREGVKAVLPENWRPCRSDDGDIYFFNFMTGESVWDHPCDEYYRNLYKEERRKLTEERDDTEYQETQSLGYQSSAFSPQMPPVVVAGPHAELLGFGPVKSLDSLRRKPLPALGDHGKSVDVGLAATVPTTISVATRAIAEGTAAISLPASPATATDSSIFSRDKGSGATGDYGASVAGRIENSMTMRKGDGEFASGMVLTSGRHFHDPAQFPPAMSAHARSGVRKGQSQRPIRSDRRFSEQEVAGQEREPRQRRHTRDGSVTASTSTTDTQSVSSGWGRTPSNAGMGHRPERKETSVQSGPPPSNDPEAQYYGRTLPKKRTNNVVRVSAGDMRGGMRTVGTDVGRTVSGQPGVFWQSDTDSGDSNVLKPPAVPPGEGVVEDAFGKSDDKRGQPLDGRKPAGVQTVQPTDQQLETARRWKEQDQKESAALQAMGGTMDPVQLQQQLLLQVLQKQSAEEHGLYIKQRQEMEVRVMERLMEEERDLTKKLRAALTQRIDKEIQKEEGKLKSMKVASMQAKLAQEMEGIRSKIWEDLDKERQQRVSAMEAETQQLQEDEKNLVERRKKVESAKKQLAEDEQDIQKRSEKFAEKRDILVREEFLGMEEVVHRKLEQMEQEMRKEMIERLQESIQKERQAMFEKMKEEVETERQEMMAKAPQELQAEAESALVEEFKSMEMRTAPAVQDEQGVAGGGRHGTTTRGRNQVVTSEESLRQEEREKMEVRVSTQVEEEERSLIEEKRKEASERVAAMLKDMEHQRGEIASQIEAKLETERKRMEEEMKERLLMISKAMKAEEARWMEKQHAQEQERQRMEAEAKAYFQNFEEASIREQVFKDLTNEIRDSMLERVREQVSKKLEEELRASLHKEVQETLCKDIESHRRNKLEEAKREVNAEVERWRQDRVNENIAEACAGIEQVQGVAVEGEKDCTMSFLAAVDVGPHTQREEKDLQERRDNAVLELGQQREQKDLREGRDNPVLVWVQTGRQQQKDLPGLRGNAMLGDQFTEDVMRGKTCAPCLSGQTVNEGAMIRSESRMDADAMLKTKSTASVDSASLEPDSLRHDLERQLVLEVSNAKRELEQRADRVHKEAEEEMRRREMLLKEELKQLVDGKQNAMLRRLNLDVDVKPSRVGKPGVKHWDTRHFKRIISADGHAEGRTVRHLEREKRKSDCTPFNRRELNSAPAALVKADGKVSTILEDLGRFVGSECNLVEELGVTDSAGIALWDNVNRERGMGTSEELGGSGSEWWAGQDTEGKVQPSALHENLSSREMLQQGGRDRIHKPPSLPTVRAACSSDGEADDETLSTTQNDVGGISASSAGPGAIFREPFAKWENVIQESAADRERRLATAYVRREHLRLKEGKIAIEKARESWHDQLQAYRKLTDRSRKEVRKYTLREAKLEIERQARTLNTKAQEVLAFEQMILQHHEQMRGLGEDTLGQSFPTELSKVRARPTMSAPASPIGRIECVPEVFRGWATIGRTDVSRALISPTAQQERKRHPPLSRDPSLPMDRTLGSQADVLRWSPRSHPLASPSLDRKVRNGSLEQHDLLASLPYKYNDGQQAARDLLAQHSSWLMKFRNEISAAGLSLH